MNFRPFCKASDWFGSFLSGEPYAWVIDQAEIKMAGYWPNSFFACKLMDQEQVKVHKLAKKERGQHPAILTRQVCSMKDLLYGFLGNFPCGIQRVVASRQDSSTLHTRVANHRAQFVHGASYTVKSNSYCEAQNIQCTFCRRIFVCNTCMYLPHYFGLSYSCAYTYVQKK